MRLISGLERSGPEKSHNALMADESTPVSNWVAMADLRLVLSPLRQQKLTSDLQSAYQAGWGAVVAEVVQQVHLGH